MDVELKWRRGTNGGAPVTNYLLQYSANYGVTWAEVSTNSTSKTATLSTPPLAQAHLFRVAAVNRIGPGTYGVPIFGLNRLKANISVGADDIATFTAQTNFTPQPVLGWPSGTYTRIPSMTSNTAPSGTASGFSNAGSNYWFDGTNAWRVFANKAETRFSSYLPSHSWLTAITRDTDNNFLAYIQYEFPTARLIGGYSLQSVWGPLASTVCPKTWTLSGSDDGNTFTTIDSRTITSGDAFRAIPGSLFSVTLDTPVLYKIYRWTFTRNFEASSDTTGVAAAQLLPPSNAIKYQWQAKLSGVWRDLSRQTDATLELTATTYAALTNTIYAPGLVPIRCVASCANYATNTTPETIWFNVDTSNFSAYFSSPMASPSGTSTENGISYSLLNLAEPATITFNLYSYSYADISWFSGNNWTINLQTSTDGSSWGTAYTTEQRASGPTASTQITSPAGTSYWRWVVQHNWPLTLTNGQQCAAKSPPPTILGYGKIVVAA